VVSQSIKKTALFNLHEELGAKMVPFAGYSMPLLYPTLQSHIESHHWVRQKAGLFDVSHMLQSKLSGDGALSLLNKVTPTDFSVMPVYNGSLSVLLNSNGGIVDDLIVIREPGSEDSFHVVSNAARSKEVTEFLNDEIKKLSGGQIDFTIINNEALLALQGPLAAESLNKLIENSESNNNLKDLYFGQRKQFILKNGIVVNVMRGGYTGEDGFEIAVSNDDALKFAELLLSDSNVKPIGLAARDSLRLEAGMCLYGNELDMSTTPVEANLNWLISKTRRTPSESSFNGFDKIMDQLNNKTWQRRRVGFQYIDGKPSPAARHNDKIFTQDKSTEIGVVTSGSISPTLSLTGGGTINIGQAYLKKGYTKTGNQYFVQVRKKFFPIEIKKMPFVPSNYYKG